MFKKLSKAQMLIATAIISMLVLTVSAVAWTYIFKTSYTIGTYVSPPIVEKNLGALFTDTDGQYYQFSDVWGQYDCHGRNMVFLFTLQNVETLQEDFLEFSVSIYTTEHPEGLLLTLANPFGNEGLSLQGSITYEIQCVTKPDVSIARAGMVLMTLNVYEPID